jgi:hypothetical protein
MESANPAAGRGPRDGIEDMSPAAWILVTCAAILAFVAFARKRRAGARRAAPRDGAGQEPPVAESRTELEARLGRALEKGDREGAAEIRTKLRVLDYWERKASRGSPPGERVPKSRSAIGDEDVLSKRFNNFR